MVLGLFCSFISCFFLCFVSVCLHRIIEDKDDHLFQRILWDKNHILHALFPDRRRSLEYELRPRSHDRELVPKVNLTESNFLIRQLYKNCYTNSPTLLSLHVS